MTEFKESLYPDDWKEAARKDRELSKDKNFKLPS